MSYTYPWLTTNPPKMIAAAVPLIGIREAPGGADNPVILGWAKEAGVSGYRADAVPWCGLFLALVATRAGKPLPPHPLWALDWAKFGVPASRPALGDVLVFRRPAGGHVGLYVAEDAGAYHVLGGNQGDRVCILRIARARLHAARRPAYAAMPPGAIPHRLAAAGRLSVNEA